MTYYDINSVKSVMQMKENHVIQGKWVDCKSAIPVNEMKLIQNKEKESQNSEPDPIEDPPMTTTITNSVGSVPSIMKPQITTEVVAPVNVTPIVP